MKNLESFHVSSKTYNEDKNSIVSLHEKIESIIEKLKHESNLIQRKNLIEDYQFYASCYNNKIEDANKFGYDINFIPELIKKPKIINKPILN